MADADRTAIAWLLESDEPGVRLRTRRDILGDGAAVEPTETSAKVDALLAGQQPDGGFGVGPYKKYGGAHWRLISLVELEIPAEHPPAVAAANTVFDWLTSERHIAGVEVIDGLTRRCASQEGNALAVAVRLGLADDPRARRLAESLIGWQWPDGGWNCDRRASGRRSSFHETLPPAWGLHAYATATGKTEASVAAQRAAELLLSHRVFRRGGTGDPIHPSWMALHYPPYWHYDVLQALLILSRMGLAADSRCDDALDHLERRRLDDGRWKPGGYWWHRPGSSEQGNVEVVDWGRSAPNEMITLNALTALTAAGRI